MSRARNTVLAAFAVLGLSAIPASQAAETIKIGVFCPFSADNGVSARNGIRLAVEEINTMVGGVNGKKIELVERDDQANTEIAKKLVEEMITKDKVVTAMGVCNTGLGMAVIDLFQNAKVPLIIPVATGTALTTKFSKEPENWIFRMSPRDDLQAKVIVADALKRGLRKVAIFADSTGYGEAGKNDVEKALADAGLAPVSVHRFSMGVKDLSEEAKAAKAAGANVVISYTLGPEAAVIAKSIDKQKWPVQIIGSWPMTWRSFIDSAGTAGEGALVVSSFLQQASFLRRNSFILAYQQKFKTQIITAPMAAAQGYDAMMLLFYALHQAQSSEPAQIKAALENMNRSVAGVITTYDRPFSKTDHDAITANMLVIGVVRKGALDYAYREDAMRGFVIQRKTP